MIHMKKKKKQKKKFYYIAKKTTIRLTSNRDIQLQGIYTSATYAATATAMAPSDPQKTQLPLEAMGSASDTIFCTQLWFICKSFDEFSGRYAKPRRGDP